MLVCVNIQWDWSNGFILWSNIKVHLYETLTYMKNIDPQQNFEYKQVALYYPSQFYALCNLFPDIFCELPPGFYTPTTPYTI